MSARRMRAPRVVAPLFALLLAGLLAAGCTGVEPNECTRNCDAQEAAMCLAQTATEACYLLCDQRRKMLDEACYMTLESLYRCQNEIGYKCSTSGLPQLNVPGCGSESRAATICLGQPL